MACEEAAFSTCEHFMVLAVPMDTEQERHIVNVRTGLPQRLKLSPCSQDVDLLKFGGSIAA